MQCTQHRIGYMCWQWRSSRVKYIAITTFLLTFTLLNKPLTIVFSLFILHRRLTKTTPPVFLIRALYTVLEAKYLLIEISHLKIQGSQFIKVIVGPSLWNSIQCRLHHHAIWKQNGRARIHPTKKHQNQSRVPCEFQSLFDDSSAQQI